MPVAGFPLKPGCELIVFGSHPFRSLFGVQGNFPRFRLQATKIILCDKGSNQCVSLFLPAGLLALTPFAAQAGETVNYSVDGEAFEGYMAKASGTSKGLVLVIHDWDGLTDYEVKRSEMLASMGYDAFAVDLYGKGNRPVETGAKKAETGKLYKNRERMRSLILGGLMEARKSGTQPTVVMGYCFGGAATLELARSGKASECGWAIPHSMVVLKRLMAKASMVSAHRS